MSNRSKQNEHTYQSGCAGKNKNSMWNVDPL